MDQKLTDRCEKFIKLRDIVKSTFKMENVFILPICANKLLTSPVEITPERLKMCRDIINNKTGVFSTFRGNIRLPVIASLAASNAPEEKFDAILSMYELLKTQFSGSEYLASTAMVLTEMISESDAKKYIERGKAIYKKMKSEHPILTASEDIVFAILLAFSERSDDELISEMEKIYKQLKMTFSDSDAVQTVSHILSATDGSWEQKCDKFNGLFMELKNRGKSYGKHFQLSILAAASVLPIEDSEKFFRDIVEIDDFLDKQKGYGGLGIDKKNRLMHAVMLAIGEMSEMPNIAAIAGTLSMIAAQQAAMIAIMCSTISYSASTPS